MGCGVRFFKNFNTHNALLIWLICLNKSLALKSSPDDAKWCFVDK